MSSQEPDESAQPSTHHLEAGATATAWLFLAVGLTFGLIATPVAVAQLATSGGQLWWLLLGLGLLGLLLLPMAISAWRLPTRDATVQVGPTGLVFTLRDGTMVRIDWAHIAAWGTVPRRAMGAIPSRSLVAWPSEGVPPEVGAAAAVLWRGKNQAWVVEAVDPEPDLVAAFTRHAPDLQRTAS